MSPESRTDRCKPCTEHRNILRVQESRATSSAGRTDPGSHANYRTLTSLEKDKRLRNLHSLVMSSRKQVDRLRAKLSTISESRGVEVDDTVHSDLQSIMTSESENVLKSFPEGSFARIFWEQQLDAASRNDARGMRWHPLMVKWCLYLRHKSSGAYDTLRESGCIKLPSQRTLRDYTHYVKAIVGFSAEVDQQLFEAAKLHSCKEYERCVVLLLDEMYIKEDLVYDKHSGSLIGFADLGDINNHLLAFERSLDDTAVASGPLARTMLAFMVQGLLSRLSFPYAQFCCNQVSGDLLFNPFWEAVYRLERLGLKVKTHIHITCRYLPFDERHTL